MDDPFREYDSAHAIQSQVQQKLLNLRVISFATADLTAHPTEPFARRETHWDT